MVIVIRTGRKEKVVKSKLSTAITDISTHVDKAFVADYSFTEMLDGCFELPSVKKYIGVNKAPDEVYNIDLAFRARVLEVRRAIYNAVRNSLTKM